MGTKVRVAVFPKEYKKFALRASQNPQVCEGLAGVVRVADSHGKGVAYVKFSEALVVAVGRALPYGVSFGRSAYLKVVHVRSTGVWRVFAYYISEPIGKLLWETPDRPEWIKKVRRAKNGRKSAAAKNPTPQ